MKKLIFLLACTVAISFACCSPSPGTVESVSVGGNSDIEVSRVWLEDGGYVYVSRYKDQPKVVTTTWREQQGKYSVARANVLYENDSIAVIRK